MEVQSLRLSVSDADLNHLAHKAFSWPEEIRDLRFAVVPEGLRVVGSYQQYIAIPFQMLWQVSVSEGKVTARIARVSAGFLSLGFIKGYLLKLIAAASSVVVSADTLVFDVDALLAHSGWPVRTNLTSIRCNYGSLILQGFEPGATKLNELSG